MKHSFFSLLGAAAIITGTASCSQEIEGPAMTGDGINTISVNIPVSNTTSRAVPEIPQGYTLRCIMQLVDANGNPIAETREVKSVAAGSESVDFTFIAPADGYQGAMFWADYVKDIDTDYIYTTTDLKSVEYNTTNAADVFNNDAADAFYGYMLAGNKSITLTRPFTRITFKNTDAAYAAYTTVKVTDMPAPTSFNVMTGNTDGFATGLASNDITIGDEGTWFSAYLFVGNNSGANLGAGNDIALTLTGAASTSITISGADIPLTRNYDLTALISATPGDVSNVTVTFPGGMVDPNAPRDIALGDFVNADGTYSATFDAAKAVAIVYALGNGATENGKTVAAYAFALENAGSKLVDQDKNLTAFAGTETITNETFSNPVAGPDQWLAFENIAGAGNNMVTTLATWAAAHPLTGANLSEWYVGSAWQMANLVGVLFNDSEWTVKNGSKLEFDFPTRVSAVYDAFHTAVPDGMFTHNGTVANFLSSSLGVANTDNGAEGKIACVQVDDANHTFGILVSGLSGTCAIRPILSIYK